MLKNNLLFTFQFQVKLGSYYFSLAPIFFIFPSISYHLSLNSRSFMKSKSLNYYIIYIIENNLMKNSSFMKKHEASSNNLTQQPVFRHATAPKSKNFLVVAEAANQEAQSVDQDNLSNDELKQRKPKNPRNSQDYVQLPKINFMANKNKDRKYSDVNIALPQINDSDERPDSKTKGAPSQNVVLDNEYQQIVDEGNYSYGWNINKIKIIPNKENNYLESDFQLLPTEKQQKKKRERKKSRDLQRQRQRLLRERNMEMVSNFLSGKASVIWLFILGPEVTAQEIADVNQLYTKHIQSQYQVPICRSYAQATKFLSLQNCFFKVVVDTGSSQQLLLESITNKNITSIYLYNSKKIEGISKAFEIKKQARKIKGIYTNLNDVVLQAQEEIENQTKFIKVGDQLQSEKPKLRFPGFVTLSQADKSQITSYRLCLYGSLKLKDPAERESYLGQFTEMVELRYKDSQKQLRNLQQYKKINHIAQNNQQKSQLILKFYVKQTFYYVLTNSILRLSRSTEEFRPCTIPFNETYHAIKHYYQKYRKQTKGNQKKLIVYRGAKFRISQIKSLQIGSYIELLGFTSTSMKRSEAEKFMDSDSYLLEITIEPRRLIDKQKLYDHGFVQINRYGLATNAFQKEEEVLINALNVFQVTAVNLNSAVRIISLKYGAIFPLMHKKPDQLSPTERSVIQNYRFCIQTFDKIEDDGDVLLLAQQIDRCVAYYQLKVDEGESDFKIHGKLANAFFQNGDLDEAYSNALKSLQKLQYNSRNNQEIKKTVRQMQSNGRVFDQNEDFIHYQQSVDACLRMIKQDWFQLPKLFMKKAQNKFKAGDLAESDLDLKRAKMIIEERKNSFELRRKEINKRYFIRSLCCICSLSATNQLEQQKELQLLKVEDQQLQFQSRKDDMHQINIQISNLSKQIAQLQGNKVNYDQQVKNAELNYSQMKKVESSNPILQAKYQVMGASVMDKHKNTKEYENTMEKAINMIKGHDPYHKNIGIYAKVLGIQRQGMIKRKFQLPPIGMPFNSSFQLKNDLQIKENQSREIIKKEKYDYEEHFDMRIKCKQSLTTAAQNILYNQGKQSSNYLNVVNKMIEVDLDYSMLRQSQKAASQIKNFKLVRFHSEGARCYLLLSKIGMAKGELRNAFKHIEESIEILRTALLKVDSKQYNLVFVNHPLYAQINIFKAKIFNRQLKHDLALKQLSLLKKIIEKQAEKNHQISTLATLYQDEAQVQLCTGQTDQFQDRLLQAINLRQAQMGRYNVPNAITYSNLFKFLHNLQDYKTALDYHLKSTQIFSRFPPDHPNSWVIHLSNALTFYQQKQFPQTIQQLESCISIASKRYNLSHIILIKINFQFAKLLRGMQKFEKSLTILKTLQEHISRIFQQKETAGDKLLKETDDERFLLLENIYNQMKDIYNGLISSDEGNLSLSLEAQKFSKKLKQMKSLLPLPTKKTVI